ncbi:MAG TPA: hypothetical protein VGL62_12705, partial [Vicinamibacterales bacterium]
MSLNKTKSGQIRLLITAAIISGSLASIFASVRDSGIAPGALAPQQTAANPTSAKGLAPQPGPAYALILGPSSIDDGLAQPAATGHAVANALNAVTDMFGSAKPANPSPSSPGPVRAAKDLEASIPTSEYDLAQLAKTLPDDPDALYRFVTDRIALDGYDGVMRGPLVTWMSRAGGPTDKTALLAWLFVTKNIPYQFVRGSLSAEDRGQIAKAASSPAPAAPVDPRVASYTAALSKDGDGFARWAHGLLSAKNIQLGDARTLADRLSPRHYWIQISRNGTIVDLDPTIPGSRPGTHLAAIDPSFKPTALFPKDEWHYLQI